MDNISKFLSKNGEILIVLGVLIAMPYILSSFINIDKIYLEPLFYMGAVAAFSGSIGQVLYYGEDIKKETLLGKFLNYISLLFIAFLIISLCVLNFWLFTSILKLINFLS